MQDLIENFQPHRAEVTAFLSDGVLIQYFRLQLQTGKWKFQQTPVYHLLKEGGEYLMGLLNTLPNLLGMIPSLTVATKPITIEEVLGLGGSSVVYKGTHQGKEVVVKHFRPTSKARLDEEEKNLRIVNANPTLKDRITELVAVTDDRAALLLRPVGIQFVTSIFVNPDKKFATSKHFAELIDILSTTHKLGLVHRDLTLSNFFLSSNGTVFLNDWGCAVQIGSATTFAGSLVVAPKRVLKGIQAHGKDFTYVPKAEDDLEMIVKCFFGRLNAVFHMVPMQSDDIKKDAMNLLRFWDEQLAPVVWCQLLTLAKQGKHDRVAALIQDLLA